MGANEKHAATYHGGEYTPSTKAVRASFSHHRDAGMETYNAGIFDRWLETVRAEAKAEALREAADEINQIDPSWNSALWIEPPGHYVPLPEWLRERANQYKEEQ
ncbi:hypothetical protein [Glutamicibacter sp. NPDC127525]|uniref:hypothetical protein n=1 Tax=unclassified Glutamicibacter TaxID=2627139 RepID=UPI003630223E